MKPLLILIALAGCEVMYEPDVGDLLPAEVDAGTSEAVTTCGDSDPLVEISFAREVRPLLARSPGGCQGCHGTSSISGFSVGTYDALRRGGFHSGTQIIVEGDPCSSILPRKLGGTPPYGARMPYNGPPFFTSEELGKVRDWIAEGAHNN